MNQTRERERANEFNNWQLKLEAICVADSRGGIDKFIWPDAATYLIKSFIDSKCDKISLILLCLSPKTEQKANIRLSGGISFRQRTVWARLPLEKEATRIFI